MSKTSTRTWLYEDPNVGKDFVFTEIDVTPRSKDRLWVGAEVTIGYYTPTTLSFWAADQEALNAGLTALTKLINTLIDFRSELAEYMPKLPVNDKKPSDE